MATTDGVNSPAVDRPVGYMEILSVTRDERCPLLLLPKSIVGQTRLLAISRVFMCGQCHGWPNPLNAFGNSS